MGQIVWIIEDDMVAQFAMKYKINQSYPNYEVISFYTVEDALIEIKTCLEAQLNIPDKLILDLVLPDMSGWLFLDELEKLQDGNLLEIFVVSAFTNSKDRKLAKEHPMVMGYFEKPLNKGSVDEIFSSDKKEG